MSGELGLEPEPHEDNDESEVIFDEWLEGLVRVAIIKGKDVETHAFDTVRSFLEDVFLPLCRARLSLTCAPAAATPAFRVTSELDSRSGRRVVGRGGEASGK